MQVPFINYENDCMASMDDRRMVLNYFLGTRQTLHALIESNHRMQSSAFLLPLTKMSYPLTSYKLRRVPLAWSDVVPQAWAPTALTAVTPSRAQR